MTKIIVPETLWACSVLPEGVVERWLVAAGEAVVQAQPVAVVRIEGALHDIVAPAAGRMDITAPVNAVVEPGSVLGGVRPGSDD